MKTGKMPGGASGVAKGILCVLLGLSASMCGSDSGGPHSEEDAAGGGLSLLLVDDPIDTVTRLNVTIDSIEAHGNGPPRQLRLNEDVEQPVNILALENGVFATLVDGNENENVLPAGTYGNLKIRISDASVNLTEEPEEVPTPATVPPDKFNVAGPFTITDGQITELYLVFHANNAVRRHAEGQYWIHPALKIAAKTVSGSVTGAVSPAPGESGGEVTRVKVLADRGTEDEASAFAAADGSFALLPLREGTHAISVEWITSVGGVVSGCRLHEHGQVSVVAGQATDVGTIPLLEADPECMVRRDI
jgi:hypothetical protein